ncbi:ABC transporter ATP-binding protein [Dehalococcoidia bacterium]|nr:ABC transporter ATP-binding protein [Dehalococcoidia bacterium]
MGRLGPAHRNGQDIRPCGVTLSVSWRPFIVEKLLEIDNLSVQFHTPEGVARAVDGVGFDLHRGEILGLVGESGCGKTVTALSILRLISSPPGRIRADKILFEGRNLLDLDAEDLRQIRGQEISMIFQEPLTSLNPVLPIGRQVAEPLIVHKGATKREAYEEAALWLDHVKIPAARERLNDYPHQLSGGMRQRVMIAMAVVCRPKLLIADEPTTALDVTIQSQILYLILKLKEELGMSVLLITHNLGVVAQMASRVAIMYAGEVVEEAGVMDIFDRPFHPYTQGLLKAMPRLGDRVGRRAGRLNEIAGTVPPLTKVMPGCKFADRCPHMFTLCKEKPPGLFALSDGQHARCWLKDYPERRKAHV